MTSDSDQGAPDAPFRTEHLLLAVTSVNGSTVACATHGDAAMLEVLTDYYALVAAAAAGAGGRVVKVMGDGVLVAFPTDRARGAVAALRAVQTRATSRWRAFDDRCRVMVKVGAGKVLSGRFGAPGDERPDIYGDTLNRLFKAPGGEFVLMPEVEALLTDR